MDDEPAARDGPPPWRPPSLSAAIRRARGEVADRAEALGALRDAELARLELLREMLEPVLAAVPPEVELFDVGIAAGNRPRLFLDMVCFVEMGHDRRSYRLVQDRRDGRAVLHEGEGVGPALDAVTAYVARRLIEREHLLASLGPDAPPRRPPPARPRRGGVGRRLFGLARLLVDGLGMAALGALIWLGLHYARGHLPAWTGGDGLFRPAAVVAPARGEGGRPIGG